MRGDGFTEEWITIGLKSYNQIGYLREAVDGVMSQTYRPLQIVIADDAGTDGSWRWLKRRFGLPVDDENRHFVLNPEAGLEVILHRNEVNLGNLGNWEVVCSLAKGELIVKADGDDVSSPDRVSRVVEAWRKNGRKALAVCHSGWQIDRKGRWFGRLRQVTAASPLGAAMAFSPELYRLFEKPGNGHLMDDDVYIRRAAMLGEVLEIPDRLVWYRLGGGETTDPWKIRWQITGGCKYCLDVVPVTRMDLEHVRDRIGHERYERYKDILDRHEKFCINRLVLATSGSWTRRLRAKRQLPKGHLLGVAAYLNFALLMPKPIGDVLLFGYVLLRNVYWKLQRPKKLVAYCGAELLW